MFTVSQIYSLNRNHTFMAKEPLMVCSKGSDTSPVWMAMGCLFLLTNYHSSLPEEVLRNCLSLGPQPSLQLSQLARGIIDSK